MWQNSLLPAPLSAVELIEGSLHSHHPREALSCWTRRYCAAIGTTKQWRGGLATRNPADAKPLASEAEETKPAPAPGSKAWRRMHRSSPHLASIPPPGDVGSLSDSASMGGRRRSSRSGFGSDRAVAHSEDERSERFPRVTARALSASSGSLPTSELLEPMDYATRGAAGGGPSVLVEASNEAGTLERSGSDTGSAHTKRRSKRRHRSGSGVPEAATAVRSLRPAADEREPAASEFLGTDEIEVPPYKCDFGEVLLDEVCAALLPADRRARRSPHNGWGGAAVQTFECSLSCLGNALLEMSPVYERVYEERKTTQVEVCLPTCHCWP